MVFHKIPYFLLKTSSEVWSIPLSFESLVLKGILILCQLSSSAVSSLNKISQRCKPVVNKVTKALKRKKERTCLLNYLEHTITGMKF